MKKIYFIVWVACMIGFSACNDEFMDRYPLDKVSDQTFWKTEDDLKMYANRFYPHLTYNASSGGWKVDQQSDNQCPSTRNAYIWNEYAAPSDEGTSTEEAYRWTKAGWEYIRSCNYFLQRYHSVTGDPAIIERYVGEIRFFRAWFYFQKVCRYGDVPWLSRDLNIDSEELAMSRTSRKIVTDSIMADLDYAIAKLSETSNEDRLTKYAALALKSRVGLYEGTHMKYHNLGDGSAYLRSAVAAAEAIIHSNLFSLYQSNTNDPATNYYQAFIQQELRGNPEAILCRRYLTDLSMHNRVRELGEAGDGFTKDFANTYLCDDGKPIRISPKYQGESVTDYLREFQNRDPRMKQTIYTPDQPYLITSQGENQYQAAPQFDNGMCFTGYRIYKFFSPLQSDSEYQRCTLDEYIFRYGETLLNYAEAKAELGECTDADLNKSINLLRDRVGMPHLDVNVGFVDPDWPNWEIPVTPLINEIRRERRIELAAEGFRFDDLVRWKAGTLANNRLTYSGALDPATGAYRDLYPGRTRAWNNRLYLYPVPTQELTVNPNFKPQNPGWE